MSNTIARRGQLKGILTRFWHYISTADNDVNQIHVRKEKVEETWQEFCKLQADIEIETGNGDDLNEQQQYREEFEELYYKAITEANRRLQCSQNVISTEQYYQKEESGRETTKIAPIVKLAAINVPVFSGVYAEWASFYDIYTALIHNNVNLTMIQKFFYLRSSLSESASECIKNIETTANNYKSAWNNLIASYNKKKLLVQTHVRSIYDLPTVKGKSSSCLRQFSDNLRGHLAALNSLDQRPSEWGPLLLHVICTKLDADTISEWEIKNPTDELAKVDDLIEFLDSRFRVLEAVESAKNMAKSSNTMIEYKNINRKNKFEKYSTSLAATTEIKCFMCNLAHTIYKYPAFIALTVEERIKKTYELGLCKICLRRHEKRKCLARHCFKCARAHNTMLHSGQEQHKTLSASSSSSKTVPMETAVSTSVNAHASEAIETVLLSTALVLIVNDDGNTMPCRALLDSGSQTNFITEELVQTLQLKKTKIEHLISGIGETSQRVTSSVWANIKSRVNNCTLNLRMVVVPKITGHLPNQNIKTNYDIPSDIKLADPLFNKPQKVDILIGAAHFYDILCIGQRRPISDGPIYQKTVFGWVVAGPVSIINHASAIASSATFVATENETTLENLLQRFWVVEDLGDEASYTQEERACVNNFNKTVTRNKNDGRFIVKLPFRENAKSLGKSYDIAKRRLLAMERKFKNDQQLQIEYIRFMDEYEKLGHMEILKEEDIEVEGKMCYLPHHAIRKEDSTSTKLRVVFDASCKTQSGVNLNEVLLKGPAIQDDIIYILARFRMHNYVLTADITKMYRQIKVTEEHRDWQRILWRTTPEAPIKTYRLNTVTYDTVPASYLATACLKMLAETCSNEYTETATAIVRDFYMDDFLGGAETKEKAVTLMTQLITIMSSAGMKLRKWSSNDIDLIKSRIPEEDIELSNHFEVDGSIKKILGLCWDAHTDRLRFKVPPGTSSVQTIISKREILSDIASIFDPLGLVGPVVIRAKIMLQALWREKIKWDEAIPATMQEDWLKYRKLLPALNKLSIPRKIIDNLYTSEVEIHGFSDASEVAYGCCLYIRRATNAGSYFTNLIYAKSKVAPIKILSIPRLELCAALLLSRMAAKLLPKLQINIKRRYFWTDSTIVLAWISSAATNWKVFVANRVSEIQDKSSRSEWWHIRTKDNPADVISRGHKRARVPLAEEARPYIKRSRFQAPTLKIFSS